MSPLVPLVPAWGFSIVIIGLVSLQSSENIDRLFLDPNFSGGLDWYVGLVSNIGVLGWATAAVSAFWGAWWCRLGARGGAARFLGWGGVLGTYLMLDDLFELHAGPLPEALGVSKHVVEAMIVFATLIWVVRHWGELLRTRWPLLVAAGAGLAGSIVIDAMDLGGSPSFALLSEDGAKLLGIAAWAAYFVATSADIGRSVLSAASAVDRGGADDSEAFASRALRRLPG